jgi:hypothetical protein
MKNIFQNCGKVYKELKLREKSKWKINAKKPISIAKIFIHS